MTKRDLEGQDSSQSADVIGSADDWDTQWHIAERRVTQAKAMCEVIGAANNSVGTDLADDAILHATWGISEMLEQAQDALEAIWEIHVGTPGGNGCGTPGREPA